MEIRAKPPASASEEVIAARVASMQLMLSGHSFASSVRRENGHVLIQNSIEEGTQQESRGIQFIISVVKGVGFIPIN